MAQLIDTYTFPLGWTNLKTFLKNANYEDAYARQVRFSLMNYHSTATIRVKNSKVEPTTISGLRFGEKEGRDFGIVDASTFWIYSSALNNQVDITASNFRD